MKKYTSNKRSKKNKKNKRKTSKKGCGCKSNIFLNMKKRIVGGNINPASFQNFQTSQNQYYYDVNTHNNDPNNTSMLISSRTLPNIIGGKKKYKKHKMTKRIIKGGDPISSFGNYNGANIGSNIFSGNQITNNDVVSQPAYQLNSGAYKLYV